MPGQADRDGGSGGSGRADPSPGDLAALARLVEGVTSRPGYTRSVGTRVVSVDRGRATLAVDRRPDLVQFSGAFHGGVIAGLADHAAGAAVTTALPAGRIGVTVDLAVNYLAPATGDVLLATATAIRTGRTISTAAVDVLSVDGADEVHCARATVTLRTVPLPEGSTRG